jgi:hypothetical protein
MTVALPQSPPSLAPTARPRNFTPEFEFLLACCAETANDERLSHLSLESQGEADWAGLARLAQRHGVVPQLYHRLAENSSFRDSLAELRELYVANARQTLWLTGELLRTLKHFENRGLEALPYKGPVLAEMLYGNVSMRQFSDLDLLVRPADLPKIKALLAEQAYELGLILTLQEELAYLKSGYEYTFDSPGGRNLLEIKWQILPRFYCVDFAMPGLFARAVEIQVNGVTVRTLSHEDLVLVLCVHAAKHAWARLSWLCDLAALAKIGSIDWVAVREQARHLGIQRIVAVTFLLAHRLLAAPLPGAIEQYVLTDFAAQAVAEEVIPLIASGAEYDTESPAYFRLTLKTRERWQDRVRFLWRLAFTPGVGEWSVIQLPGPLFPLYRVVRICRLVKRAVQS